MLYVEVQKVTPIRNYGCCCCMLYQFYLSVGSSLSMICIRFSILRVWVAEITVKKKYTIYFPLCRAPIGNYFIFQCMYNIYLSYFPLCRAPLGEDIIMFSLILIEVMN
jgi:hypothetical protein